MNIIYTSESICITNNNTNSINRNTTTNDIWKKLNNKQVLWIVYEWLFSSKVQMQSWLEKIKLLLLLLSSAFARRTLQIQIRRGQFSKQVSF